MKLTRDENWFIYAMFFFLHHTEQFKVGTNHFNEFESCSREGENSLPQIKLQCDNLNLLLDDERKRTWGTKKHEEKQGALSMYQQPCMTATWSVEVILYYLELSENKYIRHFIFIFFHVNLFSFNIWGLKEGLLPKDEDELSLTVTVPHCHTLASVGWREPPTCRRIWQED